MGSILDILFDILEVPLRKWDKLAFKYKVIISVFLGLILLVLLTNI